jgi:hypothetical protein
MKLRIIAGAAATALVLSTGLALAQTPAAATAQYSQAAFTNAAYVGDGSSPTYLSHGGGGPNG